MDYFLYFRMGSPAYVWICLQAGPVYFWDYEQHGPRFWNILLDSDYLDIGRLQITYQYPSRVSFEIFFTVKY